MSITLQPPRTIILSGPVIELNNLLNVAGGAITPGYLVERYNDAGVAKWRNHSTASGMAAKTVALNASMLNKGIDDPYAVGDGVEVGVFSPGCVALMMLASGESVVTGDFLESKGDGTLRKYTSGVRLFQALEVVNNSAGIVPVRIRAEAL